MNTDSFFTKGDTHKVCQDYAISGEIGDCVYAIVCDGCSSSAKVDIGARLLAEIFVKSISFIDVRNVENGWENRVYDDIRQWVAFRVGQAKDLIGLEQSAFDATLLAAVYVKSQGKVLIFQWGDGVVTKGFYNGMTETGEKIGLRIAKDWIVYDQNAPNYFSYTVWPERGKLYRECFPEQKAQLHIHRGVPNEEGSYISYDRGLRMTVESASDLRWIHLSSDGIDSFQDSNENRIDVADEFTSFKNLEGEFVQRRMNRLLKEIKKQGASHYDDLGVAAIAFD